MRLPADKLIRLQQTIRYWASKRSCTKRELLSLIGQLQHAATVVKPGRTFLRRMIDLAACFSRLDHHIRLNAQFRSDLQWWSLFLPDWNRSGFFQPKTPTVEVVSDASGSWGCGVFHSSLWFQYQWPGFWQGCHIAAKEMVPIVFAAAIWGPSWSGQRIRCKSDNSAVVTVVNTGSTRDPLLMHMLRCLFFYAAHCKFSVSTSHLPGKQNIGADALSLNNLDLFFSNCPQASHLPSPIPPPLVTLVVTRQPDWTSKLWQQLFSFTLKWHSKSTERAYKSAQQKYINFCCRAGKNSLPLSEDTLVSYVAFLAQEGLKHQTIKCYLSAIRHFQIAVSMPDPFHNDSFPYLEYVLKGIKKTQAQSGPQQDTRLPITPTILRHLQQY